MSKRIKVKLITITTRAEAEAVMNELSLAENNRRKIVAKRDAEVLRINDHYAADIAACEDLVAEKTDTLRAWAELNAATFPNGNKSIELVTGRIGFRTGTPKLALLNRAWNWEKVLAAAQAMIPKFIRQTPELDKAAILNQRDDVTLQHAIRACGMKVAQDETFYVEPALTDLDARQAVEVAK